MVVDWDMYASPGVLRPLPMGERPRGSMAGLSPATSGEMLNVGTEHSLGSISQALLDEQFGELDRIIGFEDGTMFAATLDVGGGW